MNSDRLSRIQNLFRIRSATSLYIYAVFIGVFAGLFALLFSYCLGRAEHFFLTDIAGMAMRVPAGEFHFNDGKARGGLPWLILLLPACGGLCCGLVTHYFGSDARGSGTDDLIKAFHRREGRLKKRLPIIKSVASILTLGTGGSGGKEGPTGMIGAGIGSLLAHGLGAGARARRTLLLVGTAAGLGAIFRAPLGGAITAVEVLYREDIESDSLIPCIIASVTGHLVYTSIAGSGSVFRIQEAQFVNYSELLVYFVLALLCFSIGGLFAFVFKQSTSLFERLRIYPPFKPMLGGLGVGLIGYFFPEVIGTGDGFLQGILLGQSPPGFAGSETLPGVAGAFLTIGLLKIVTTTLTVSSGGSAGVFGPSLFIGGMLGGCVGTIAAALFPEWNISVVSFVLVGMGSFFSGIAHAPIAGMIMVCDLVGSYKLLPPLMIVSILAILFSRHGSIYASQVKNRFYSPAHYWDMNLDVLNTIVVRKVFDRYDNSAVVRKNMLLSELDEIGLAGQMTDFIVVNADGSYHGIISLRKTRLTQQMNPIRSLITLEDADFALPTITPDSDLGKAFQILMQHDVDKVAIVDAGRVIGYLTHRDILKIYSEKIKRT